MNQIPNIEETHNTREELIKVYYKDFNHYNDIDVKFEDVYEFIHHQLQKARQDWLREEIVRLENEKFVWLTPEEMKEHDGCRYKKGGLYVGQVAGNNFNGAIQIIQHRYHSELDQDTKETLQEAISDPEIVKQAAVLGAEDQNKMLDQDNK